MSVYAQITGSILTQLREGAAPWVKPWSTMPGEVFPMNAISKRRYNGGNTFWLWGAIQAKGYSSVRFVTYKQALEAGGHVRKGEKANPVFYWSKSRIKDKATQEEKDIMWCKGYSVFNLDQCEGLDHLRAVPVTVVKNTAERHAAAEATIKATGSDLRHGGDKACYWPGFDRIDMPEFETFHNPEGYYSTLFHEHGHWTGHKTRLDREGISSPDRTPKKYAFEELVAELSAAFLCAEHGIDGELRHAGYIEHWIKLLSEDERAFISAASKAQKAADFIMQRSKEDEIPEGVIAA